MDKTVNIGGQLIKLKENPDGTYSPMSELSGTSATNITQESGGTGALGWLSSIYAALTKIQPRKIQDAAGVNTLYVAPDGSLKTSSVGKVLDDPVRKTLVADVDTLFTFSGLCQTFNIMNFGPGDIYYRIDSVASVNGATSVFLPAGMGQELTAQGTVIHVISSGTPLVQILGVK